MRKLLVPWTIICIIGICLITRNPKYDIRNQKEEVENKEGDDQAEDSRQRGMSYRATFTSWRFWHLFTMLFFGEFYGVYMASVYKIIAEDYVQDHQLALAGALGGIGNGISRLILASMVDKFGFKAVYSGIILVQLACSCGIWSCRQNPILLTIIIVGSYCTLGGHFSCFPPAAARIFGIRNSAMITTLLMYGSPISSLLSFVFVHMGFDYKTVFTIAAIFTSINVILLYFFDDTEVEESGL